jgi:hypothetical protein
MVVLPPDALVVDREHRPDFGIWQGGPFVSGRIIDLSVFTDNRRRISTTNGEDPPVGLQHSESVIKEPKK